MFLISCYCNNWDIEKATKGQEYVVLLKDSKIRNVSFLNPRERIGFAELSARWRIGYPLLAAESACIKNLPLGIEDSSYLAAKSFNFKKKLF
jgi:hypothetical protein